MIGERFGMLTIVGRAAWPAGQRNRGALWLCRCDCGGARIALASYLRAGRVQSCGCRLGGAGGAGGKKLTATQRARARRLAAHGRSISAIARAIGVTWNTARAASGRGAQAA